MTRFVLVGTFLMVSACSSSSDKVEAGQDNLSYRYTVKCRNEVQDCYNRCSELCPDGYLVTNRVHSRRIDQDNAEYSVIIRCKQKIPKQ